MKTRSRCTIIIGLWLFISIVTIGCMPAATAVPATGLQQDSDGFQTISTSSPVDADDRHHRFSMLFAQACIERTVYTKHDKIVLHWPSDMTISGDVVFRIMAGERIYAELHTPISAGSTMILGNAYVLPQGKYEIVLMPSLEEYYVEGMRIERRISIEVWPRQDEPLQEARGC